MFLNHKSEKGQVLVLVAGALIVLFGLIGLAMDGGQAFSDRRKAQNAVDTAAYAASLTYLKNLGDPAAKATDRLNSNGYSSSSNTQAISISSSDLPLGSTDPQKCTLGSGKIFTVSMTTNVNTWFAGLFGFTQFHNAVSSSSRACTTSTSDQFASKASVLTCHQGTCGNGAGDGSLRQSSASSSMNLKGGGLFSDSTDDTCVALHNGTITLEQNSATPPACASVASVSSGYRWDDTPVGGPGCSNTFLGSQVQQSCPADLQNIVCGPNNPAKVGVVAQPGTYGNFPPSGATQMAPGLYCITGNFNGGAMTGNGVTIFMENNGISLSGSNNMDIRAAKSSDYPNCSSGGACPPGGAIPGLLIYAPSTNTGGLDITGNGTVYLQGTVLAKSWQCFMRGGTNIGSSSNYAKVQVICDQFEVGGNGNHYIEYNSDYFLVLPSQDYIGLIK